MTVITIPRPLREKLGDDGTDAFIEVINKIDIESKKGLATEAGLLLVETRLTSEIARLDEKFSGEIAKLDEKLSGEIASLKTNVSELKYDVEKINDRITDVIKWVAAMLVAQAAVIAAIVRLLSH
ncbi:MAG: hypothetical protein H7844_11050 [Nitrospirae bacterium YQR-1]